MHPYPGVETRGKERYDFMFGSVRGWLTPPHFDDDFERTNAARVLHFLLLIVLVILLATLVFFTLLESHRVRNVLSLMLFTAITLVSLWRLHHGNVYTTGRLYLIVLWIMAMGYSLFNRGILSSYPALVTIIIWLAGIMVRPIYSVFFAIASVASVTVMLFISQDLPGIAAFYPPELYLTHATSNWFVYVAAYMMTATLVLYSARHNAMNLERVIQRDRQLAERNTTLEAEIAERKRVEGELRQSETTFRTLIENAQIGIFILKDAQQAAFLYVNDNLARMLGYTPEEMIHRMSPFDVLDSDYIDDAKERIQGRFAGAPPVGTAPYRVIRKDGSYIDAIVSGMVIDYNGKPALLCTMIDVTAERQAERSRIELEVERNRVEFLRAFMYTMTHDLKTPLSVIGSSLYLIEKATEPAAQQRHLGKISDQVGRLGRMIEDMLTVARLDTVPDLRFDLIRINALVTSACDQFEAQAQHRNVSLSCVLAAETATVRADGDLLNHAIINLIENAINYTPAGGTVTVRTVVENEHVTIEVQDTGIGISEAELQRVFDRFFRARNATAQASGTGLGLAITKRIVDLHNGEISVTSHIGTGSLFKVRLPTAPGAVSTAQAKS